MKNAIILLAMFLTGIGLSQSKYEQGMEKAFSLWKEGKAQEAANIFERIAQVEQDNWLPPFYVAQVNVFQSFSEKDEAKLTAQLKTAQDFLNDAKALSKNNEEILLLQAQLYICWVIFDGQKYGMTMSPKIAQLYQEAYALAPDNPRVAFGKVEWEIGTAKFFGQDTKPFCEDLKKAIALFDTFVPKGKFYPQGGKEYAEQSLAQNCKD